MNVKGLTWHFLIIIVCQGNTFIQFCEADTAALLVIASAKFVLKPIPVLDGLLFLIKLPVNVTKQQ